jgi:hypothetical protein
VTGCTGRRFPGADPFEFVTAPPVLLRGAFARALGKFHWVFIHHD